MDWAKTITKKNKWERSQEGKEEKDVKTKVEGRKEEGREKGHTAPYPSRCSMGSRRRIYVNSESELPFGAPSVSPL